MGFTNIWKVVGNIWSKNGRNTDKKQGKALPYLNLERSLGIWLVSFRALNQLVALNLEALNLVALYLVALYLVVVIVKF